MPPTDHGGPLTTSTFRIFISFLFLFFYDCVVISFLKFHLDLSFWRFVLLPYGHLAIPCFCCSARMLVVLFKILISRIKFDGE